MTRKLVLAGAVALAVGGLSAGIAIAAGAGGDDGDSPLTGSVLDRATVAALAHTRGGTVVEAEIGDGGAAYSVEVSLGDGSVVEVGLDSSFDVVGQERDDDGRSDHGDDAGDAD